jgi:hypothetical protein
MRKTPQLNRQLIHPSRPIHSITTHTHTITPTPTESKEIFFSQLKEIFMRKFFYGNFFMNVPFSLRSEFGAIGESGGTRGPPLSYTQQYNTTQS